MLLNLRLLLVSLLVISSFSFEANAKVSRERFEQIKQKYSKYPVYWHPDVTKVNAYAFSQLKMILVTQALLDDPGTNEENLHLILLHENGHIVYQHLESKKLTLEESIRQEQEADLFAFHVAKQLGILSETACWFPWYQFPLSTYSRTHPSDESRFKMCLSVLNSN